MGPPHDLSEPFIHTGPHQTLRFALCTHQMDWTIASSVMFLNIKLVKLWATDQGVKRHEIEPKFDIWDLPTRIIPSPWSHHQWGPKWVTHPATSHGIPVREVLKEIYPFKCTFKNLYELYMLLKQKSLFQFFNCMSISIGPSSML